MWIRFYEECLCPLIFKLQFILGKIMQRICIPSKISPSGITKKPLVSPWSIGSSFKDNLAYWQGSSVCDCRNLRLVRSSIVYGKNQFNSRQSMEGEGWLVYEFTSTQRNVSNRWGADRVDKFHRIHFIADSRRDPEHYDCNTMWTWAIPRTYYLHVNVQRHCGEKKETEKLVLRILLWLQIMFENSQLPELQCTKNSWKVHQNTVYWCNLRVAQRKVLQFYQARSNAIILYNTLPWLQKKRRKLVISCTENMQQQQHMLTQKFILKIKFDTDRNNNSKDMKRIVSHWIRNRMELLSSCYHHKFFFIIILVATIRQLVDMHGIGNLHHGMSNRFVF